MDGWMDEKEGKEKKNFAPGDRDRTFPPWIERALPGNGPTDKIPEIETKETEPWFHRELVTS